MCWQQPLALPCQVSEAGGGQRGTAAPATPAPPGAPMLGASTPGGCARTRASPSPGSDGKCGSEEGAQGEGGHPPPCIASWGGRQGWRVPAVPEVLGRVPGPSLCGWAMAAQTPTALRCPHTCAHMCTAPVPCTPRCPSGGTRKPTQSPVTLTVSQTVPSAWVGGSRRGLVSPPAAGARAGTSLAPPSPCLQEPRPEERGHGPLPPVSFPLSSYA